MTSAKTRTNDDKIHVTIVFPVTFDIFFKAEKFVSRQGGLIIELN